MTCDVALIGAGPAGCAAAITAARRGLKVLLLESGQYPRHKVCGEFVSAESAEVLHYICTEDLLPFFSAPRINSVRVHARGRTRSIPLALAGYSIPRYQLDESLWRSAQSHGVECRTERVEKITGGDDTFLVFTEASTYSAKSVVNASGRWSRLTRRSQGQPWIGLKAHFAGEADDAVDLYFLPSGYCGVQMVSPGVLNACALVRQGTAKTLHEVFAADPSLSERAREWSQTTTLFATAPVYLGPGSPAIDSVLQAGDAAGFVDPFVGDGISLALRSGVLAGRCAGTVSPAVYAALYRRAFGSIFRHTARVRRLQSFAPLLQPFILGCLGIPGIADRVFHRTRQSQIDVLHAPLVAAEP